MPDTVLAPGGETTGSLPSRDTGWVLQRRRKGARGGQGRIEGFLEEVTTNLIVKAEYPSTSWATTPAPEAYIPDTL